MRGSRKIAAVCLALLLLGAAASAQAAVFHADVRVQLSVGKQRSLSVTPVGEYTLREDSAFAVGTDEVTIQTVGGRVSITAGGKTVTAASLTLESKNYGKTTDYIRLKNAEYGTCTYLGDMTFDVSEGAVRAINTLPLEQYLYGVVPHEMSNSFPVDALKAQAVCARGYAAANCSANGKRAYDLVDTSKDQVYRGYASKNTRAIAAVDATKGQVLTYDGDIIESYYSASNGGQTERTGNVWKNDFPYYVNADDPYDLENLSSLEEKSFLPARYDEQTRALMDRGVLLALEREAYKAAGAEVELLATVSVQPRAASYDAPSRCYTQADVTLMVQAADGKQGQITVTLNLEELEFGSFENTLGRIGAKKIRLRMRGAEKGSLRADGTEYSGWYLTVRRYGHGVGLSQRGAQERARQGQGYADILAFYYVNTQLNTVGSYGAAPKLSSDSYKIKSWGVSGVSLGTSAEKLLKALSSEGKLSVVNAKGAAKTDKLVTGDFVRTTYDEGKSFFDLPIVIFGDLNGDGAIEKSDVEALQGHLLRTALLSGPYFEAADVNHDGEVDLEDLLRLIQYTQDDAKISQGGN